MHRRSLGRDLQEEEEEEERKPSWGGSTGIDRLKVLSRFNRLKVLRGPPGASECRMPCLQSGLVTSSTPRVSPSSIKLQVRYSPAGTTKEERGVRDGGRKRGRSERNGEGDEDFRDLAVRKRRGQRL